MWNIFNKLTLKKPYISPLRKKWETIYTFDTYGTELFTIPSPYEEITIYPGFMTFPAIMKKNKYLHVTLDLHKINIEFHFNKDNIKFINIRNIYRTLLQITPDCYLYNVCNSDGIFSYDHCVTVIGKQYV